MQFSNNEVRNFINKKDNNLKLNLNISKVKLNKDFSILGKIESYLVLTIGNKKIKTNN